MYELAKNSGLSVVSVVVSQVVGGAYLDQRGVEAGATQGRSPAGHGGIVLRVDLLHPVSYRIR